MSSSTSSITSGLVAIINQLQTKLLVLICSCKRKFPSHDSSASLQLEVNLKSARKLWNMLKADVKHLKNMQMSGLRDPQRLTETARLLVRKESCVTTPPSTMSHGSTFKARAISARNQSICK